jgi:hypothetical protein
MSAKGYMESARDVRIDDLRCVVNLILDHMKFDLGLESCPITKDLYYEIDGDALYAVGDDVGALSVGSLRDDWEFLQPLLTQDRQMAVSLMLIHVAPLLRYLGQKIGQ